jgi:hypothetical protein
VGRPARLLLALLLVAAAVTVVVARPVPEGPTLVSLTRTHGIHASDLAAVALLLVAAWFGVGRSPKELRSLERQDSTMTPGNPRDELLDRIHLHLLPRTYVEIGVATGRSLTLALPGTRTVGIDPAYSLRYSMENGTQLFRMTSDDFFARYDLTELLGGRPVELAFIDGMHHFEFALRDFMNLERRASPDSVILAHDCYPIDAQTATRERHTKAWSGDVWKLILVLKQYRSDLLIRVVDVPPTGLAIVRNLNPASSVLDGHYQQIVDHFIDLPYEVLDEDKDTKLNAVPNDWDLIRSLLPAQPFRHGDAARLRRQRDHRPLTVAAIRGTVGRGLTRQLRASSLGRRVLVARRQLRKKP